MKIDGDKLVITPDDKIKVVEELQKAGVLKTLSDLKAAGASNAVEAYYLKALGNGLDAKKRNAEVGQEQLHQQRRALEHGHIAVHQAVRGF